MYTSLNDIQVPVLTGRLTELKKRKKKQTPKQNKKLHPSTYQKVF